jgi:hypothetical protein
MAIVLAQPIERWKADKAEIEAAIGRRIREVTSRTLVVELSDGLLSQLALLGAAPASPSRDGLRERGQAFAPCFHVVVPDEPAGHGAGWRSSLTQALLPPTAPAALRPAAAAGTPAPLQVAEVTLGFSITLAGMMLLASVRGEAGAPEPLLSFSVLSAGLPARSQGSATVRKASGELDVLLPDGRSLPVPPAFARAALGYLQLLQPAR